MAKDWIWAWNPRRSGAQIAFLDGLTLNVKQKIMLGFAVFIAVNTIIWGVSIYLILTC